VIYLNALRRQSAGCRTVADWVRMDLANRGGRLKHLKYARNELLDEKPDASTDANHKNTSCDMYIDVHKWRLLTNDLVAKAAMFARDAPAPTRHCVLSLVAEY
jgi:hypothetical protein